MSYRVVKTIYGRKYFYEQSSRRFGRRVRTTSVYLGPLDEIGFGVSSVINVPVDDFKETPGWAVDIAAGWGMEPTASRQMILPTRRKALPAKATGRRVKPGAMLAVVEAETEVATGRG